MYDYLLLLLIFCVYLVTMATKLKKTGSNLLKIGENSFLANFAQILFIRDVYGGLNSHEPQNGAIAQHPERLQGVK